MSRVSIIGHYGFGKNLLNGQTIKTKIVTQELRKELGESEIETIDIANGKRQLLKLFFDSKKALKNSSNIIMMPTEKGVMFFTPVLSLLNHVYKKKLHYIVIGGWLQDFLSNKKCLLSQLKKFDGIYVETSTMKKALESMGFSNIAVMPNCKDLKILKPNELVYSHNEPYKLCTFSRVMKEKGIEDITYAVSQINKQCERIVFTLDIYGQVDANQQSWFDDIRNNFPEFIQYKGEVEYSRSVEILHEYFALVFPTKFYTEGIPGTVIDAYAAGLPVISSKWESFEDVIDDGVTGLGYAFDDKNSLVDVLETVVNDPAMIDSMRKPCIEKAKQFIPEKVISEKIITGGIS